jgi:aminoglycoside phosphotransferase (APT) family kinase protein
MTGAARTLATTRPPGVDWDALVSWMDTQELPAGPLGRVTPLTGGTQNLMFRIERGDCEYVLRRGPRHLRESTNAVLLREMTVLAALDNSVVPHAAFVAGCTDPGVLNGSVFYLMTPVDGCNLTTASAWYEQADTAMRLDVGPAMVDALVTLGDMDASAEPWASMGTPSGFLERQLSRWHGVFHSYKHRVSYPASWVRDVDTIHAWLTRWCPSSVAAGVMHGDYHLGNVMFASGSADLAAIVDWEMCTIGDPLLDLGWLLATWSPEPGAPDLFGSPLSLTGGAASRDDLVQRYALRAPARSLDNVRWYTTFAQFKLAILLEGTHVRSVHGEADPAVGRDLRLKAERLLAEAAATASAIGVRRPEA